MNPAPFLWVCHWHIVFCSIIRFRQLRTFPTGHACLLLLYCLCSFLCSGKLCHVEVVIEAFFLH